MKDLGGTDHGVETIINWISQSFLNGNDMEIIMNKGDEMYDIIMAAEKRTDNKGNCRSANWPKRTGPFGEAK